LEYVWNPEFQKYTNPNTFQVALGIVGIGIGIKMEFVIIISVQILQLTRKQGLSAMG